MARFDTIESIVNTRLKNGISADIKAKYPTIQFSTEPSTEKATFPHVYTQELEPVETGNTLANNEVNAEISTVQLTVTTNTSKGDCKKVAWACVDVLKGMRYKLIGLPLYNKQNDVHTYVLRARRTICSGDTI